MVGMLLRAVAVPLLVLGVAAPVGGFGASPALAQAAQSQRDKKPGQTCEELDRGSQAFRDCVTARAQTTKESKPGNEQNRGAGPAQNPGKGPKKN